MGAFAFGRCTETLNMGSKEMSIQVKVNTRLKINSKTEKRYLSTFREVANVNAKLEWHLEKKETNHQTQQQQNTLKTMKENLSVCLSSNQQEIYGHNT